MKILILAFFSIVSVNAIASVTSIYGEGKSCAEAKSDALVKVASLAPSNNITHIDLIHCQQPFDFNSPEESFEFEVAVETRP